MIVASFAYFIHATWFCLRLRRDDVNSTERKAGLELEQVDGRLMEGDDVTILAGIWTRGTPWKVSEHPKA
jgi:hypothetical protein